MRRHFRIPEKLTMMCSFRASYLLNGPISQLIQRPPVATAAESFHILTFMVCSLPR